MGGGTLVPQSLKTQENQKKFKARPKIFLLKKSYLTLLCLPLIVFPKFDQFTATEIV